MYVSCREAPRHSHRATRPYVDCSQGVEGPGHHGQCRDGQVRYMAWECRERVCMGPYATSRPPLLPWQRRGGCACEAACAEEAVGPSGSVRGVLTAGGAPRTSGAAGVILKK